MQEIEKLRVEIDEIHIELTQLLKRRLGVAHQIWRIKKSEQIPFFDGQREELLLQKLKNSAGDEYEQNFLHHIFKTILAESKICLEAKLQVSPPQQERK